MIKLMIVDDEQSIRKGLRHYINWSTWGVQLVAEAASAEEALDKARLTRPDILLTDIRMDKMDGIELTRRLKEWNPALRVILLTGYDNVEYLKAALKIKVDEYLLKPAGAETIIEAVLKLQQEILKERNKNQQDALRDTLLDENIPIIQMYFIDSLLKGGLTDREKIESKAARLEIPLHGPWYQVLLVDAKGNMFDDYLSSVEVDMGVWQFTQGMHQIVGEFPGVFWCNIGCALALVVVNAASRQEIIEVSGHVATAVLSRLSGADALFVGIGIPVEEVLGLGESFRCAKKALGMSAWHKAEQVLYYTQTLADKENVELCRAREAETLSLVAAGRGREAIEAFKSLFACYREAQYDFGEVLKASARFITQAQHVQNKQGERETLSLADFHDADMLEEWMVTQLERLFFTKSQPYSTLTRKALDYMAGHYRENITLQSLAKVIFVSPNYLGRVFLGDTGHKLGDWLNRYRIERAQLLLRETDMKTYEIAEAVGFSSYKYFSVCFLKYVGSSARDYRNAQ